MKAQAFTGKRLYDILPPTNRYTRQWRNWERRMPTVPAMDLTELLRDIPRGAWVAISSRHEKVIAYGSELRAVIEEAKSKGEDQPLIARVPETLSALML